jgi:DNA-binding SARP family transcriptional activator
VVDVRERTREPELWTLHLLGGFELRGRDGPVEVPNGVQRLMAYVALQGGAVARVRAAADLWPGVASGQAAANLRSTLWRARRIGELVAPGSRSVLRLSPTVRVDVHALADAGGDGVLPLRQPGRAFNFELLPDWFDDWVLIERERLRHLELRVLDSEAEQQLRRGQTAEALDTILRAIRLEPLREASHQALIRAFLRDGDRSAALSHYEQFAALLREELGLGPDPVTTALVAPYLSRRRRDLGAATRKAGSARRSGRPRPLPRGRR